jgi:hypothetical protein
VVSRVKPKGALPEQKLEPQARLAVQRFVKVLARCGCAPQALEHEVSDTCRQIPKSWLRSADLRDSADLGHVMTLWFSDPEYFDAVGAPRPLSLRGSALSIEALARRIDPTLDVRTVLKFLQRAGSIRRVGTRYLPRDRVIILRGRESMTPFLRGLFGLLKTLEHNSRQGRRAEGWLELFARNPRFPASAAPAFEKRLRRLVTRLLIQFDADMHRHERTAGKGERTVRMGVGVYRFEEDPPPRANRRADSKLRRKSTRRRRAH